MIYENGKPKMKRIVRQFLSGFLALLMVVGLIPATALAAPAGDPTVTIQADVNGSLKELNGASISYDTSDDYVFTITAPDTASGGEAWAGWDENTVAIVRWTDNHVESAYAVRTDDTNKTATFRLNTHDVNGLSTSCTITVASADYRSVFTVKATGQPDADVTYGDTHVLPAAQVTDTPDGQVFIGWKEADGTIYAPGAEVTVKKNLNFTEYFADVNAEQYIVTFQDGTGNVLQSAAYDNGAAVTAPADPSREGYTFAGWDNGWAAGTTATANVVYTAQWTAKEYDISLDSSTASNVDIVSSTIPDRANTGDTVVVSLKAKAGYEVTGVILGGDGGIGYVPCNLIEASGEWYRFSFTMPAANVKILAVVHTQDNEVTFMTDDEGVWDTQNVATGDYAAEPAEPTKEGYTFEGWSTEKGNAGKIVDVTTTAITKATTYYAIFTQNTYTVTKNLGSSQENWVEITKGAAVSAQEAVYGETITINVDYQAAEDAGYYLDSLTVTTDADGAGVSVATVTKNSKYTFVMPAGNVTVTPVFKEIPAESRIVKFVAEGALYDYQIVVEGDPIVAPAQDPSKEGYGFVGWFTDVNNDATKLDATTVAGTDDVTYTAKFDAITYAITTGAYVTADKTEAAKGATVTLDVSVPAGQEVTGLTVVGADGASVLPTVVTEGEEYTFVMPAQAVNVEVQTKTIQCTVKYMIDGDLYDIQTYDYGTLVDPPVVPAKEGYTDGKWVNAATGTACQPGVHTIKKDVTYVAQYALEKYEVTTHVEGADVAEVVLENAAVNTYDYGTTVKMNITTPKGYVLKGIVAANKADAEQVVSVATIKEGVKYSFTMPAFDVDVTAYFEKVPADCYVIKYVADGSLYDITYAAEGETITAPADPAKTGYTFEGWYDGADKLNSSTTASKDVTYEAKFEAKEYAVATVVNPAVGGASVDTNIGKYGEVKKITLDIPVGYAVESVTVIGDNSGNAVTCTAKTAEEYQFTMPAEPVTVTVNYAKVPAGKVIVKFVSDGSVYDLQVVTKGTDGTTPAEPVRAGYEFQGWSADNGGTLVAANYTYTVPADYADDELVYEAQWKENQKEFNVKTGTPEGVDISCAVTKALIGEQVTFKAEADADHDLSYVTVTTDDGKAVEVTRTGDNEYVFTMPADDVTISAKALEKIIVYTIDFRMQDGTLVDRQFVVKGEAVTLPAEPSKEGYNFKGWYDAKVGGNQIAAAATATSDAVYYAQFDAKELKVTYADLTTGVQDVTVLYGSKHKVLSPADEDNFICWSSSDGQMMLPGNEYTIKEDVTLTAVRQQDDPIYLVNFKGLDGKIYYSYLATTQNQYQITAPEFPKLSGYDINSALWSNGSVYYAPNVVINVDSDLDFVLDADPTSYDVNVDVTPAECGSEVSTANAADYNSVVTLTVNTPNGYVLKSVSADWLNNGIAEGIVLAKTNVEGVYTFTMPAGDVDVHVEYEKIPAEKVLVKFMNNGELYDYQIVDKGSFSNEVVTPDPTMAGKTFEGWSRNGGKNKVKAGDTYSIPADAADVVVYEAYWKADEYTVTYALDGGTPDYPAETVEYGEQAVLPAAPTKAGFEFAGWLSSQTNMVYNAGAKYTVTDNVTFTAQWTSSQYVVKFVDAATGVVYGYEAVAHGDAVTAPAPEKTGYTLVEWVDSTDNTNTVDAGETFTATKSVIYVAKWEKQIFNVTSTGSNCTVTPATQTAEYNANVEFTVVADNNYEVDTVYITYTENGTKEIKVLIPGDNGAYSFTMPGADVQIVASAKKTVYQISTKAGANTAIDCAKTNAATGEDVEFTVESTNKNYRVGNVYVEAADGTKVPVSVVLDDNGNAVYHFTMPEQDVTIKSQAVQGEYTVTYLDSDNTLLAQKTVKAGETTNAMAVPAIPEGYVFAGWKLLMTDSDVSYAEGEPITVEADMYLKAVYEGVENTVSAGVTDNIYILKADQGKDMSNSVDLLNNRANTLAAKNGTTVYFQVAAKYNWTITDITIVSADGNSDLVVVPTLIAKSTVVNAQDTDQNGNDLYTYAFTMPAESVEINIYTEPKEYNVKVVENIPNAGDFTINGYTTTNRDVAQGSTVEIAVMPVNGYKVASVIGTYTNKAGDLSFVQGSYDYATNTYSFPMVPFDVTVDITYVAYEYNVNVTDSNAVTYDPQATGRPGTALELENVDNKGYVALLNENGEERFEDPDMDAIYYPANAEYQVGDLVSFVVKTYRGWVFDGVTVTYANGTQSCQLTKTNGIYYFNMPAADDVKITANFVKDTYTITKRVNGEDHGSIEMNGLTENKITSAYKDDVNVVVTPDAGYYVKSISYALDDTTANDFSNAVNYTSGVPTDVLDGSHEITFKTPSSDVKVTVEYGKIDYTLQTAVNGAGTVVLSAAKANVGDRVDIATTPDYGYKLVKLEVTTASGKKVDFTENNTESESGTGSYYFTMPAEAVTVTGTFVKVDYVVTYVNYDNTVIAMEGVTYKDTADVAGHVGNVVSGPVGQHFVGWTSADVETPVTAPSVDNTDFVIVKDTIIVAEFEYDQTDVVFADTVNGTVASEGKQTSPEFTLNKEYDDTVSFTATPAVGYEIDTVSVMTLDKDGNLTEVEYVGEINSNKVGEYTFKIPATYKASVHEVQSTPVTVEVTFKKSTYTLTQADDCETNGTIAVNGTVSTQTSFSYEYNDEVTITATPNDGYYVTSIIAEYQGEGGKVTVGEATGTKPAMDTPAGDPVTLTFNMPAKDVTYKVTYAKIDYSITRVFNSVQGKVETFDENGNAIDQAQIDDKVDITVTPNKGYALKTLTVTYDNGTQSVVFTGVAENEFTFRMPAKAVTVTAEFTVVTYTARLTKTGEGNVTLNTYFTETMNADYLDTVTINADPADGWHLKSIKVTGDAEVGNVAVSPAISAEGGDYTFVMPNCDVKVEVVFEKNDYSITVVSDKSQGTVTTTPADSAQVGDVVKVNVKPNQGYALDDLTVTYADGQKSVALTKISDNNYTFTMPAADVTVTATYKTVTYTAVLDKTGEGTVRLNGHNTKKIDANYKDTVTVEITPDDGWRLVSVQVNNGDVEVLPAVQENGGEYTFTMPNYDVEISVVMEKIDNPVTTYVVNAYEDGHGTVTMNADSGQVGDRMTIIADPDDGYRVKRVVVTDADGNAVPVSFVSEGADYLEKWSFTMPASAVEVKVVFEVYAASYYTDCRTDDWYYEAVTYLTDKGLMTGMTDDLFGPQILMTREMFVTVLARMENINVSEWAGVDPGFTDANVDEWYAPYLAWAKANGVTTGYTDGSGRFGVAEPITREQMFTMMYRYAKSKGVDMTVTYPQFMDRYVDKDEISEYAYEALVWCVSEGIAKGMSDTTINPQDYAPRAHAAQMFKNYIDYTWYR